MTERSAQYRSRHAGLAFIHTITLFLCGGDAEKLADALGGLEAVAGRHHDRRLVGAIVPSRNSCVSAAPAVAAVGSTKRPNSAQKRPSAGAMLLLGDGGDAALRAAQCPQYLGVRTGRIVAIPSAIVGCAGTARTVGFGGPGGGQCRAIRRLHREEPQRPPI